MIKKSFFATKAGVFLGATTCCLLWGSAFPGVKIGYALLRIDPEDWPSLLLYAGIRFALAGVLVIAIGSVLTRKLLLPKAGSWPMVIKIGLCQTVLQYTFYYIGILHTTGIKGSIITASGNFFSILFACCVFHLEKLTRRKVAGCLSGFIGMVLLNWTGTGLDGNFSLTGEGFMFCSCVLFALSYVLLHRYSAYEQPVILSGYQFLLGGMVLVALGVGLGGEISFSEPPGCVLMLYLAALSAVAYSLWGTLLKYNPVSRVTIFGVMTPIFGVLASAIFLNEWDQISWPRSLSALFFVCSGIWILNAASPEQEP